MGVPWEEGSGPQELHSPTLIRRSSINSDRKNKNANTKCDSFDGISVVNVQSLDSEEMLWEIFNSYFSHEIRIFVTQKLN